MSVIVIKKPNEAVIVVRPVKPSVSVIASRGPSGSPGVQGPQGNPGPQGPIGPPGGSYRHVQSIPASVWTIIHNLNFYPNVTILDSSGAWVEGEKTYPDSNTVILTFLSPFSGEAYLS